MLPFFQKYIKKKLVVFIGDNSTHLYLFIKEELKDEMIFLNDFRDSAHTKL